MPSIGLEVPVFGGGAARNAVAAGASRIELNAAGSYPEGGLTPSLEDLRAAAALDVPLRIMIRPRGPPSPENAGRDFIYSDDEFARMRDDIAMFKDSGLLNAERGDGFVFGILVEVEGRGEGSRENAGGCAVDVRRCADLVDAARPFKTVFHRAFDEVVSDGASADGVKGSPPWRYALRELARCRFDGILTSGGLGSAADNMDVLAKVMEEAGSLGIEIIVGGGVRSKNVPDLRRRLPLGEEGRRVFMHSSCLPPSETEHVDRLEVEAIVKRLA